jgi:hypothetical protein
MSHSNAYSRLITPKLVGCVQHTCPSTLKGCHASAGSHLFGNLREDPQLLMVCLVGYVECIAPSTMHGGSMYRSSTVIWMFMLLFGHGHLHTLVRKPAQLVATLSNKFFSWVKVLIMRDGLIRFFPSSQDLSPSILSLPDYEALSQSVRFFTSQGIQRTCRFVYVYRSLCCRRLF